MSTKLERKLRDRIDYIDEDHCSFKRTCPRCHGTGKEREGGDSPT